ncbi:PspA/IM30 family protein [Anabaena sp. FACHB-1237]|uniref:PspA/IM30 family protein n=1 Tax=Anabaena sp. FACHB-1237 TaxID=2692769 RepID=UPI00168135ED|nr:PspA/IM30 family protein [Anabaena sp. FACHB-1237]MBD2139762.1 PspA/IM30 family protein [Anabaena sp. FACHB-1237]
MEVMKRIVRVIRANVNSWIKNKEDPEKILENTFMEMQENLVLLRQGVAGAIATQKRTERQAVAAESNAQEWYNRAELALEQGKESLAREALTKRQFYQQTATALLNQVQDHKKIVAQWKDDMRALELKIAQMRTKKDMYIARARSAEANYRLKEMLSEFSPTSTVNALASMEEKVLQLEAQSQAIGKLGGDNLEIGFAALKSNDEIDVELAMMKNNMLNKLKS